MSAEIGPSFVIGQKIGAERGCVSMYGGSGCTVTIVLVGASGKEVRASKSGLIFTTRD